jgi:hypothetical protein
MALRFCLVGLVVTLGFELPSGEDISSSVRSGWNWVFAADDGGLYRVASAPEASPGSADEDFAGIVDRMAQTFATDLARNDRPPALVAQSEVEEWSFELLREPKPAVAASTGRADRLMSAVKLTQRAASAWAQVFASVEESAPLQSGSSATEEEGADASSAVESSQQPVTR